MQMSAAAYLRRLVVFLISFLFGSGVAFSVAFSVVAEVRACAATLPQVLVRDTFLLFEEALLVLLGSVSFVLLLLSWIFWVIPIMQLLVSDGGRVVKAALWTGSNNSANLIHKMVRFLVF